MNIHLKENLGDMRSHMLMHMMRWIHFTIAIHHFKIMTNCEMAILELTIFVVAILIDLLGLEDEIVMTIHMITMAIGHVLHSIERVAVKRIMAMVDIVMTLIMTEAVGEM